VYVEPVQLEFPHDTVVGCFWQPPAPSQVPVFPQVEEVDTAHCPVGAAPPAGMFVQVPGLPGTLQDWQVPQAADAQQTPSTQLRPARQSAVVLQVCPWWLRPQMFAVQCWLAAQSVSLVQAVLQVVPLQAYGLQSVVVAAWHFPLPSQVCALVWVDIPVGQLGGTQTVPAEYRWHAPVPSQTPVVPHDAAPMSLHVDEGSIPPATTLVQVPAVLVEALHDLQVPLQVVEQQTPWLQIVDLHSLPVEQVRPRSFRPHDPLVQDAGDWQSLSVVQALSHWPVPQMYG
jgi:hypothetical protein